MELSNYPQLMELADKISTDNGFAEEEVEEIATNLLEILEDTDLPCSDDFEISGVFTWSETKQGPEYWLEIHNKLKETLKC